jgi:novel plant SNARE
VQLLKDRSKAFATHDNFFLYLSIYIAAMASTDLMELGRKQIKETDGALMRSERLVNHTIAIGGQTAETLQTQGKQLERVAADLDNIHFSMRKARQVLRDVARGLATDKCIMFFLLLVIIAIVVIVILKVADVGVNV